MTDTVRYLEKIPGCRIVHPNALVTSEAEAEAACALLNEKGIDLLVMHFVTFPAGALIPCIANRIQVPVVLLANPEEAGPGKMWEQNSFCGANLGAFVMRRLEKQYGFAKVLPAETPEGIGVVHRGGPPASAGSRTAGSGWRADAFPVSTRPTSTR